VFPADSPITTKSLLRFILSELDPATRVELSLLSPGCSSAGRPGKCAVASSRTKRLEKVKSKCVDSQRLGINKNSTSKRESCLSTNKASVSDRIQVILDKIQDHFLSQMETELGRGEGSSWVLEDGDLEDEYGDFLAATSSANLELEHLRSMKLTLEVS
jgi:hypothetical protein